ncbi:MAG TPA: VWA domain-containing protein, partial [Longimicrobiaceae bacterium]|nr:VWA domain-containing protein [Longimicrobiaceae bacterium]
MNFSALAPTTVAVIVLIPLLMCVALVLYVRRRRRVVAAIGDARLVAQLAGTDLLAAPRTRMALILLTSIALALVIGPGASDHFGGNDFPSNIVLVLDASGSMRAEDVATTDGLTTRLEMERRGARQVVGDLRGKSVGLVVFAGDAFILSPQTYDYSAIQLYLDALSPSIVSQTGSSLSSAIRQGVALLADTIGTGGGTIVLISDGDALEPRPTIMEAVDL